jgi:hypothetical protein
LKPNECLFHTRRYASRNEVGLLVLDRQFDLSNLSPTRLCLSAFQRRGADQVFILRCAQSEGNDVDVQGKIVREAKIASDPEALVAFFASLGFAANRIGLEADGGLEIALIDPAWNQIIYCWLSDRERRMSGVCNAVAL